MTNVNYAEVKVLDCEKGRRRRPGRKPLRFWRRSPRRNPGPDGTFPHFRFLLQFLNPPLQELLLWFLLGQR